ncbi:MAG: hypothetical protein K2H04_09320 [Bacteroidaceae bacterium]|nr:hypothetical protein [Bacteroidaceae bacterium]
MNHMMNKWLLVVLLLVTLCGGAVAQNHTDSTVAVFDDLSIPLVEKKYVANTNFQDNWYLTLYGGVTSNWGSDASHAGFFRLMGPAAALAVGKEITPISAVRFQINYTRNTGVTDDQFGEITPSDGDNASLGDLLPGNYSYLNHNRFKWNSYAMNIDYLLNFTNLLLGFREHRKFHFQGIVGIGGSVSRNYGTDLFAKAQGMDNSHSNQLHNLDKYDNRQHSLINLRAGVAATFLVARNWNIHMEAVANILDNSYDSNPTTKNTWDGHVDYLLGVSYRFNNKGGQAPGFYYPRHDMSEYRKRIDAIQNLQDQTKRRRAELEAMTDTIDVDAQVMYTLIAFDEGSTTIDRLQQTNIFTTAYAWSKTPRSIIYITNSTGVDDKLFRKRANAVQDVLLERYEVPYVKVRVVASEKDIKPVGDYIELIIND